MIVRWSQEAAEDLRQIFDYIRNDRPESAERVINEIYVRARGLVDFPKRGRTGRVAGTCELALTRLPYIVIYRESPVLVEIAKILHGAQRWP